MGFESFLKNKMDPKQAAERMAAANGGNKYSNDEFYYPKRDENKTADVVIRFLPAKDEQDLPYVTTYSHFFKGDDGKWFIMDMCPTTFGEDCGCCTINSSLWSTERKEAQDLVRQRKRKKSYIFQILVEKDKEQPDRVGKVFPFKCGQQIFDKIMSALNPEFEDEAPKNPFDIMEGNSFNFRIKEDPTKKQTTYEASKFADKATAVFGGDIDKIKAMYESMVDLKEVYLKRDTHDAAFWNKKLASAYSKTLRENGLGLQTEDSDYAQPASKSKPRAEKKSVVDEPMEELGPEWGGPSTDAPGDDLQFFQDILNGKE